MLKKIWSYLTFQKQQTGEKKNFNLAIMHGINRLSILVFLLAMLLLLVRYLL